MPETRDQGLSREERILKEARRRFAEAAEAEEETRREALIDLKFRAGDQWKPEAKQLRESQNRPCITINRTQQFVRQVTNAQRQQRPGAQVSPVDGDQGDRDSAEIWQGLIRHIEVWSDAETAYDTAFEHQVGNSFGAWRIRSEYAGMDTFDQELKIERILDPFSVYVDPNAKEPDRSDMQWAFIVSSLTREEFERLYPDTKMSGSKFFDLDPSSHPGHRWLSSNSVQIAEYWRIEYEKRTLQLLNQKVVKLRGPDGAPGIWQIAPDGAPGATDRLFSDDYSVDNPLPEGVWVQVRDGRPVERAVDWPKVKWFKITGSDILDEGDWPGRWIPILVCYGDELLIDGKRQYFSLTRGLREPQIVYNVMRSEQATVIGLTPKAPFIGYVGQFKTAKARWETANMQNWAYLEVDPVTVAGTAAPLPQRNMMEPPIASLNAAAAGAVDELKACSGIYDASLGNMGNETSGRAIFERKQQGDIANFHFFDNFKRALRHQYRMLMDLIPYYYDRAERIIRIVKPNNETQMVTINAPTTYKGKPAFFDPEVGRYDVNVGIDNAHPTRLQETFAMFGEILQTNPQLWGIIGDLVIESSPLPSKVSIEAAKRIKATLPPAVSAASGDSEQPAIPPEVAQKMEQLGQMVDALTQQLNAANETINSKRIDIDARYRETLLKVLADLVIAEGKIDAQKAQTLLTQMIGSVKHERMLETQDTISQRQTAAQQAAQPAQAEQPAQAA